jgi:hypothetical protein
VTYAPNYNRRSSSDAELREAIAASDQALREAEERRRAEDEERDARQRARKAQAAVEQQRRLQQQQEQQAPAYDWDNFWRSLDQRIAAGVNTRIAAYQESERTAVDTIREVMDKLADNRRELASARDREVALKERVTALEERVKQPGPLPIVKQWIVNSAALAGEMFASGGALWQCRKNTGQPPQDGEFWICVSAPGRDGESGKGLRTRGLYRKDGNYKENDLVVHNGGSWIARRDGAGPCPGDDWQVGSLPGKRGETGERGLPGPKPDIAAIEKAMSISSWTAGDDYAVTPMHANGQSGATLDLRPLFEKFFAETR